MHRREFLGRLLGAGSAILAGSVLGRLGPVAIGAGMAEAAPVGQWLTPCSEFGKDQGDLLLVKAESVEHVAADPDAGGPLLASRRSARAMSSLTSAASCA